MTIYGDFATGYIVTPTLPPDLVPTPRRRVAQPPDVTADELAQRLTRAEALLADAQLELSEIRRRLG